MKFYSIIIAGLSLCVFFSTGENKKKLPNVSAKAVTEAYLQDFILFQKEIDELVALTSKSQIHSDLFEIKKQIKQTRYAYKRVEFIFDYFQPKYNYQFINGGPLPKVAHENADVDVIPPNGLQTLDEIIYSKDVETQLQEILELAKQLNESIDFIASNHLPSQMTDRQIIEATRTGVIRVFTLGLTGFDTPGSANAIEEAKVSMNAMEVAFLNFEKNTKQKALNKFLEIKSLFQEAQQLLESNSDFDFFDRMNFLTKIINPIYKELYHFQQLNDIPSEQLKTHAQNYSTENLFEEDFINTNLLSEFSYMPLDDANRIELGKILFFDPILSKDLKMSCASCHDPNKAFTDHLPKSKTSIEGIFTKRNSMTLIDAGYTSRFFWDMRDFNLEKQVAHVVNDSLEFNINFYEISARLNQSATYVQLFEKAYKGVGKKRINRRSISNAIAAYVNSLKSFNSPFDQYARGEVDHISKDAINGFNLFMGKAACGTCHFAPIFNGTVPPYYIEAESEVLGMTLGLDTIHPQKDLDGGRLLNDLARDEYPHFLNSMKTVTIRNIELTAPYMHNGLFATLDEVVEFYNQGGGVGMGLEYEYPTLSSAPLNLSKKEKRDIITFMNTLTDTTGLTHQNIIFPEFENHSSWNQRNLKNK